LRGAVYVDGFNLYHALAELKQPHLKWLNLRRLSEVIARGHATEIGEVVFCTAYFPGDTGKRARHRAYVDALRNVDVQTLIGHTTKEPMDCEREKGGCGRKWDAPREKETDINVALAAFHGAMTNAYDVAFIVSADTDQVATFLHLRRYFPNKHLVSVVPPGRPVSAHLQSVAQKTFKLNTVHIDESVFPHLVTRDGLPAIRRPPEYAPPEGWVHPDERPAKKKPTQPVGEAPPSA